MWLWDRDGRERYAKQKANRYANDHRHSHSIHFISFVGCIFLMNALQVNMLFVRVIWTALFKNGRFWIRFIFSDDDVCLHSISSLLHFEYYKYLHYHARKTRTCTTDRRNGTARHWRWSRNHENNNIAPFISSNTLHWRTPMRKGTDVMKYVDVRTKVNNL